MKNISQNKREYAFDILRVISMIMVITIHVSNVYSRSFGFISNSSYIFSLFYNTVSRISVPIFLMISGALLLDRKFNTKKYFKRLFKYVLLIIVWDIVYLVWEYLYLGVTYDKLYKLILEPYRAHLWFLYTILILYAIQPLLKIILDKTNNIGKIILAVIWFLASTLSMLNYTLANIFTIFSYIGFFVIGKYLYDLVKTKDIKKYSILLIIIMIICYLSSIYLNYTSSIKFNRFYNLFFAYRTPFIMLSSISFYLLILSLFQNKDIPTYLKYLSSISLGVYLIHGIFLDVTVKVFNYSNINSLIGIPIFTIIIFILSMISVSIIKRVKYLKEIIE